MDAIDRPALEALGWDPDWEAAFAPFAAEGVRPARVVAVHRETVDRARWRAGDRSASVSGSFRFEALARSDFPAVGDWVALGADDVVSAILPRRSVFKRMAADSSRRGTQPRRRADHGLEHRRRAARRRASTTTSTCAASSATSRSPCRARSRRSSSSTRPTWPTTSTAAWSRSTRSPRASPRSRSRRGPGQGLDDAAGAPAARDDGGDPRLVRGRQVDAGQRPARRGPPGDGRGPRLRLARPAHDDPPRAVRAARRGAAGRHARHPGARGRSVPRRASRPPSTTSPTSPRPAGSAIAATTASRAARSGLRWPTARCRQERLASHQKLERELARAAREGDPRARAEHRRTWKIIHKSGRRAHEPQVRRGATR